jgi:hypothetical protein
MLEDVWKAALRTEGSAGWNDDERRLLQKLCIFLPGPVPWRVIHAQYRGYVKFTHPDKGGSNALTQEVNVAFDALKTICQRRRDTLWNTDVDATGDVPHGEADPWEATPGARASAPDVGQGTGVPNRSPVFQCGCMSAGCTVVGPNIDRTEWPKFAKRGEGLA